MFHLIRIQDVADILIMTVLVYLLYKWFRNTKALQVFVGLVSLAAVYFVTKNLGLFMTSWILQELGTVVMVLIIVIFQNEIRQALYRFSSMRNFLGSRDEKGPIDPADLAETVFSLAQTRTGALIVFKREEPLREYLLHGIPLDCLPRGEALRSIFQTSSPLHDGAVLIADGRIAEASAHLPLSSSHDLPQYFGTRHRAAVGVTERSDALVVVVSEERGEVSVAMGGELARVDTPEALADLLRSNLASPSSQPKKRGFFTPLFRDLRPKLVCLLVVFASWYVITGRNTEISNISARVAFHNLPDNLVLRRASPDEVNLQVRSFSGILGASSLPEITGDVDLSAVREGTSTVAVTKEDFHLPVGMIVSSVNPSSIRVTVEKKGRRRLPVAVPTVRGLGSRHILRLRTDPTSVVVEGPESVLARLREVNPEDVDVSGIRGGGEVEKNLVVPDPSVRFVRDGRVRILLRIGR